jgi:methyl-accepting chemotaxis protein
VKKLSIKMAISGSVLAILFAGIIVMVVVVSMVTSSSVRHLTEELIESAVQSYANEFKAVGNYGYALVRGLAPVVNDYRDGIIETMREDIVDCLEAVLKNNPGVLAIWTAWEPNALDGRDSLFVNANEYHDETGRFVPFIYWDGNQIYKVPLESYDDPVEGIYYQGAKNSGRPYITNPYPYNIGGKTINIYSIAIPILEDGKTVGVVGMDISLEEIMDIMNAGSILSDGYISVIAPSGEFATHPNDGLLLQHYSSTWLGAYSNQLQSVFNNGGSFNVAAYSDVTGEYMQFLGSGVAIGDTGRFWAVCGFVPQSTLDATARNLTWVVVGIGFGIIVLVGLTTYLLVNKSLSKLPSLTAAAGRIAAGDLRTDNTRVDDSPTKNEITLLERSFSDVVGNINKLVQDLNEMGHAIMDEGDIEARVDETRYNGSYREVVESVTHMVGGLVNETVAVLNCLNEYGNGNFNANVPKMVGKKVVLNEAMDNLSSNLKSISHDVNTLVGDAIDGKLSSRADAKVYKGDWAALIKELNKLMETIVAPINEASQVLSHVSEGNFNHKVTGNYKGDFSIIKNSINTTVTNVAAYIGEISDVLAKMAENNFMQEITREYVGSFSDIKIAMNNIIKTLNQVIGDITESAGQVAMGARSISESSMTLAQGASEQASSVEELNATIITINENTIQNAENAKKANDLSDNSKKNANKGDEDMQQMLTAMEDIKDSSAKITQIIKVIEDISFQTNLLALNAAVEAARAGEHGKGFAVVAEEVRTLASRSQVAAKETASLIQETTEKVDNGTEIAMTTANALRVIVEDIGKVSDIIVGIAEASELQAEAVKQVTQGLSQITEVVQSNSATSEETAAAAEELSSQSDVMNNLVSLFTLKK